MSSFTAAGKRLELPESTVSRKISALEARLGTRLLQRTTRASALTEAGRTYHEHCLRTLAEVEASERAMTSCRGAAGMRGAGSRSLRLITFVSPG